MIYFDSAATSFQKPKQIYEAYLQTLRLASSPGRGAYSPAVKATQAMLDAREEACSFFSFPDPERVVFTMNATHALNLAIRSLSLPGKKAVISGFEHNSVLRPLYASGMNITVAGRRLFDDEENLKGFKAALEGATLAVCTHVSNVFGYVLPLEEIASLCTERGVPLIVDASQSAGVLDLNWETLRCAFIAMPGHKSLLGVPGSGLLLCAGDTKPLLFGGSGADSMDRDMPLYLPDRLEAGTQNAPAAAALAAGIRFIRSKGRRTIETHEKELFRHMCELLQKRSNLQLFRSAENNQTGVLSFRCADKDCEEIASFLADEGICVRAGLHCSPLSHESALTLDTGTVRISFSPFNTHREVETAAAKLIKFI